MSGRVAPGVSILEFSKKKMLKDVAFTYGSLVIEPSCWLSAGIAVDLFLVNFE